MIQKKIEQYRINRLQQYYGGYRFPDGRLISIRQSIKGTLRFRDFESGESGRLFPEKQNRFVSGPGFSAASPVDLVVEFEGDDSGRAVRLQWKRQDSSVQIGIRVGTTRQVSFNSGDIQLYGRLDLPEGLGPHPAIILVHGSGNDAATAFFFTADFFAANGIAALTFDKRGTGRSQGKFTMNYQELAEDVLAGVEYLCSLLEIDPKRIGLTGYSQGGWVAPLAASQSDNIRYVIVNSGMIESPAEEARLETLILVRKRGLTDKKALTEVEKITIASVNVIGSGFRDGWESFGRLKSQYAHADWRKFLKGSPVEKFMRLPKWLVKIIGPIISPNGLDWHYNSEKVLSQLEIPMLWLLGDSDEGAPNELTIPKLKELKRSGKPFDLIVYEAADHGMLMFEEENGKRTFTGYAKGYFPAEVNFARQQSKLGG